MAQSYTGMSPIGAFLGGFIQGGANAAIRELEIQRESEIKGMRMLLEAGIASGDLESLSRVMDPKAMRSLGLTPDILSQAHQLLAPIREAHATRSALAAAQGRRLGAEATGMEATEQLIGQLSPDLQLAARVPAIGQQITQRIGVEAQRTQAETGVKRAQLEAQMAPAELDIKRRQVGAAEQNAAANMLEAKKRLDFDQQMQMLDKKMETDIREAEIRSQKIGREEADRALQQSYSQAQQNWRQAQANIYAMGKPDKKTGEILFESEQSAKTAVASYNQAALAANINAIAHNKRYGTPYALVPMYKFDSEPGMIYGTKGWRATPMQDEEMLKQLADEGLPSAPREVVPAGEAPATKQQRESVLGLIEKHRPKK